MAEVRRDQFTEGLKKDMYVYGMEKYDSIPTVYDKIFEVMSSSTAYEKETDVSGMGGLSEKKESEKIIFSSAMEGFTIVSKNRTFADGIEVSMEAQMDMPPEKIGDLIRTLAASWAEGYAFGKEEYAARFFNEGGFTAGSDVFNGTITGTVDDASGDFAYDSKPFFNLSGNTRPLRKNGAGVKYNGLALSLTVPNMQTAYNLMTNTNNRNMRNQRIALKPNILLIPPTLRFTAKTVLQSEKLPGTVNNDINPVSGLLDPLEWQYLTNDSAWFMGVMKKGLKWHDRMPLTFDFWRDPETKGYKASVVARYGAKVTNWRYWTASNFSTV